VRPDATAPDRRSPPHRSADGADQGASETLPAGGARRYISVTGDDRGKICSEIRLVRPRRCGVLSRVPMDVFGANGFRPVAAAAPISHDRGPRRREGAFIVDRKMELQVPAPVVWRWLGAPILFWSRSHPSFAALVVEMGDRMSRLRRRCAPGCAEPWREISPAQVQMNGIVGERRLDEWTQARC
jgi:hypothetical protein